MPSCGGDGAGRLGKADGDGEGDKRAEEDAPRKLDHRHPLRAREAVGSVMGEAVDSQPCDDRSSQGENRNEAEPVRATS